MQNDVVNGISVPMAPFGSNDSISDQGDVFYFHHGKKRLIFNSGDEVVDQNLNDIQLNSSDINLRTISDYLGTEFLARLVNDWGDHKHYLVLADDGKIWHFHFMNDELLQRMCVRES